MRKLLLCAALMAVSFAIACAPAANNANASKPANAANSTNVSNTNTAANSAAVESEIKKLVNDAAAALAKNDADALDKMYSDNYMLVNPDGAVQNKTERLASIRSGETKFDSFSYDEVNVRSNAEGTGAVVIARAMATGINKGRKISGPIRVTQLWVKTKDGWRQVSGQATPILAAGADADKPAANANAVSTNGNANAGK
jgi:ketosteroid isomerase-like protein